MQAAYTCKQGGRVKTLTTGARSGAVMSDGLSDGETFAFSHTGQLEQQCQVAPEVRCLPCSQLWECTHVPNLCSCFGRFPRLQCVAGLLPDGRMVVNRASDEASNYKS